VSRTVRKKNGGENVIPFFFLSRSLETGAILASPALDADQQGPSAELHFSTPSSISGSPLLICAASYGDVIGWDLR